VRRGDPPADFPEVHVYKSELEYTIVNANRQREGSRERRVVRIAILGAVREEIEREES
jgi:hypothetical protein